LIAPVANLSAIVGNLIPVTSNIYNIGGDGIKWNEIFTGGNIQTTSYVLAGQGIQTPLTETGNLNSNTALIYNEAIVGNIRTVDSFGRANLGNVITSSGVFWANGVAYSTSDSGFDYGVSPAGYTINLTNGSSLIPGGIGVGNVDTSATSLTLFGQNYAGYGEALNENLVHLLENFAAGSAPANPLSGQQWWDTTNNVLKVYTGSSWKIASGATSSTTAPTDLSALGGDLWFDSSANQQLKVYSGSAWVTVGNTYTMGNYQNWTSNVTTVSSALDQLAARLKAAGF
jgi:hypothetical protein